MIPLLANQTALTVYYNGGMDKTVTLWTDLANVTVSKEPTVPVGSSYVLTPYFPLKFLVGHKEKLIVSCGATATNLMIADDGQTNSWCKP
jgi:hypothetical protein